jgi:hypothetical protein
MQQNRARATSQRPPMQATKPSEWGGTAALFIGPYLGGPRVVLMAAIVVYFGHKSALAGGNS